MPTNLKTPIVIAGMGISGEATLRLLLASGVPRKSIFTFDQKHPADLCSVDELSRQQVQTLIVSPGIPLSSPWIQSLLQKGVQLESELSVAFSVLTEERVISITGSIGKSTTTALIGAAAQALNPNNFVGGNLGDPLARYAEEVLLNKRPRADFVILELSSYQLENFENLASDLSVLTYLSPNHLERYKDLQSYYRTKLGIIKKTKGPVIANKNGGELNTHLLDESTVWTDRNSLSLQAKQLVPCAMVGSHNLDNLAMACAVAEYFQWGSEAFDAMRTFPGLNHRLESCGRHDGVLFVNDSKSTTIDSLLQAVESVQSEVQGKGHLYVLVGGKDKNLPWESLEILKQLPEVSPIFFGECGEIARQKSQLRGPYYSRLIAALESLKGTVQNGDLVLLSPGGTSLDEFKNFEDRGNFFKDWVLTKFKN